MSTESGIPDFRSGGGFWENSDLLQMMTDNYLTRYAEAFWPRYKQVFLNPAFIAAQPNPGHRALHALESENRSVAVFTQNVDGLHQLAGSTHVYEVHGSTRKAYCPRCQTRYELSDILAEPVPRCSWETPKGTVCDTILHPDTVLFGQPVRHLGEAVVQIQHCSLLLVLGTSLTVEPVASLPYYRSKSCRLVIINLEPTHLDDEADLVIYAKIGETLRDVLCGLAR